MTARNLINSVFWGSALMVLLAGCGGGREGGASAADAYDLLYEIEAEIGTVPGAIMVEGLGLPYQEDLYSYSAVYHVNAAEFPAGKVGSLVDTARERWGESRRFDKSSSGSACSGNDVCQWTYQFGNDDAHAFVDVIALPVGDKTEIRMFARGVE